VKRYVPPPAPGQTGAHELDALALIVCAISAFGRSLRAGVGEDTAQLGVGRGRRNEATCQRKPQLRLEIAERRISSSVFGLELVAIDDNPEIRGRLTRGRLQRLNSDPPGAPPSPS